MTFRKYKDHMFKTCATRHDYNLNHDVEGDQI